jgi:predicted MPP superfamily phosphohydrolase
MSITLKEYFRNLHQKKAIRAITTVGIVMSLPLVGLYAYLWAVKNVKLDYVPIKLHHPTADLRGLKICQISDLHYGPSNCDPRFFSNIVNVINAQKPDLIVLTGDYYQWDSDYLEGLPQILGRLHAPLGVFGIFGNHDYGSCYPGVLHCDPFDHKMVKNAFARNDILLLENEALTLAYKDQDFNLIGLHDLWSGHFNPAQGFANTNADLPTILLSHNPDTVTMVEQDFDLMLSGHVHGGQVSWPWIGPLAVPVKNRRYRRGLHTIDERKRLYVNRGLGYTFRMRLNSPPEVSLIEIV